MIREEKSRSTGAIQHGKEHGERALTCPVIVRRISPACCLSSICLAMASSSSSGLASPNQAMG